jgi:hypothetical protein
MRAYHLAGIAAAALLAGSALAQVDAPVKGPAKDGTPAWFLQGSFPDPGGRTNVEHGGKVTAFPRPPGGPTGPAAAGSGNYRLGCHRSPVCDNPHGLARQALQRVQYEQTMGYSFTYPVDLPPGFGGVPAVALDSKGNLWVYQRKPVGSPQLLKYDRNYKLILSVGDDVIGHAEKAHGMAVDGHREEGQSGRQAAADDRHLGPSRRLGRGQGSAPALAAGDDRIRPDRRHLHRGGPRQ